jgi:peptidyl-prolyl cis-trans isomerase A (cyclophilin A)
MSRFAPGTATGDFILCVGDNTYMDAGREGSDDKLGYAAFGHVTKGMDVVKAILKGRIDSHTREGGWSGQMLAAPIEITGAKRIGETYADSSASA